MRSGATLWLVVQTRSFAEDGTNDWDFQGVFSSREAALAAIGDHRYAVLPVALDRMLGPERSDDPWFGDGAEAPNGLPDGVMEGYLAWRRRKESADG